MVVRPTGTAVEHIPDHIYGLETIGHDIYR